MFGQTMRRVILALTLVFVAAAAQAAPYAALVMDARTGKVLHSRNADTRLHPASLTKMMTLYITFEAIRLGEINLDTKVKISRKAANEPPSKLGLRAGQRIAIRYLIRAAAVKSANDAATALGEAVSGSEAAFARRMNRTAKALGMTRTTFKNAHGLTERGHMSTARDMATLGRRLFMDYPEYYNLFSRRTTSTAGKTVRNTNRKFLAAYEGADGIKTGYTNAAGFNLVASAKRGDERIIAALFGGRSTAKRNSRMAELLDLGFKRAPSQVATIRPALPVYGITPAKPLRTAVLKSPRPQPRMIPSDRDLAQMMEEIRTSTASTQSPSAVAAGAPLEVARAELPPEPRIDGLRVVTRVSTSGGEQWAILIGRYNSRQKAEKTLLKVALQDFGALNGALRKVVPGKGKFNAKFVGLSERSATRACLRLKARQYQCETLDPGT